MWYTLGYSDQDNLHHYNVVRGPLTKNLDIRFSDIHDEIVTAFDETLSLTGNGIPFVAVSLSHRFDLFVNYSQNGRLSQRSRLSSKWLLVHPTDISLVCQYVSPRPRSFFHGYFLTVRSI
jgi:hypothetical protein